MFFKFHLKKVGLETRYIEKKKHNDIEPTFPNSKTTTYKA